MSTPDRVQASPVPVSIDNEGEWQVFAQQLSSEGGEPTELTPELLEGVIGSAVALLFEADRTRDVDLLRGAFSDQVIAQCERNAGSLEGDQPVSAVLHLVGTPMENGHATLRSHLAITVQRQDGSQGVSNQFWDLQPGAQTTVGQTSCPNCGAPIAPGHLICDHCGTDVRSTVAVPMIVNKLELY